MTRKATLFALLLGTACASPAPVTVHTVPRAAPAPALSTPPPATAAAQGPFQPNAYLRACYGIRVSNSPLVDEEGWVRNYKPIVMVNGVPLAAAPANDVCLTSGFGQRFGRQHDGIDLQSRPAGTIYAAAPGRVIEARVSTGYGNMVLIDHGKGVYTRYAHLAYIQPGVQKGEKIGFGQPVGFMGSSGNATAVHIHYEILTGNYNNPRGSKGLSPRDPFSFPPYEYAQAY
jgi:murein DD-endopeptidase MepM/ murein hydrolase activator NlpD